MCATRAAICGLDGPSAATPLAGVAITVLTSVWIVESRSLKLLVTTGCTTLLIRLVDSCREVSLAMVDTTLWACRYSSRARFTLGGAAAPGGGGTAAAAVALFTSPAIFVAKAAGVIPDSTADPAAAHVAGNPLSCPMRPDGGKITGSPKNVPGPPADPMVEAAAPAALACWVPPAAVMAGTEPCTVIFVSPTPGRLMVVPCAVPIATS